MCGGGTTTTTNQALSDPRVSANYDYITNQAKGVAGTPFQYYPGNLVAPTTGQTQSGYDLINQSQGVAAPYLSSATGYAQQGAAPISASAIQSYSNPYQQQVIDATMANIDEVNSRQQQDVIGNAISKGAWGGDRAGVAQAELARQQGLAAGQTFAGLNAQNYQQALAAAQQDAQRQGQAAYTMGALGQEAQSTALQGANAQIGAGQLQQQQSQNEINAAYSQYQQAKQYPFSTTSWLSGILGGQAPTMGGTSSTTAPAPGFAQQAIGAGAGIAGILGATGGFGANGWLSGLFSDERLKTNIEPIGRAFDGQMIYRYNFKGDPTTQIGFLAQEVERIKPDAVREINGIKGVDYHVATDEAADRGGYDAGGIVSLRSPVIPGIDAYTPDRESGQPGPLVPHGLELKSITQPGAMQAQRGYADGGSIYGGETISPYPLLQPVNGVPVPAATLAPPELRSASVAGRGGSGIPAAPRAPAQSDIGSDVIRLAQMLRSAGLGKGSQRPQQTPEGGYDSVGSLVRGLGLNRGGMARKGLRDGGSYATDVPDEETSPWVTAPMPRGVQAALGRDIQGRPLMAPPTPIDLPYAPDYSRLDRSEPPAGFVPMTTALASLRDEMQPGAVAAPAGVAAAPDAAPVTVAAAPAGVAGRQFPSDYAARISRVEGVTPDATNPYTGAAGYYQFMPDTAYGLAQRTAWGRGLSKPQVMAAIKADPAKQDELLSLYNGYSTGALKQAGLPTTDANLYALHAFGPAGGVSLLRASPDMPMADWVRSVRWDNGATPEQVIAQNGLAKYRTVGDLRRGFIEARIGGASPSGVAVAGARPPGGGAGVAPPDDGGDDSGDGAGDAVEGDSAPPSGGGSGVAAPDDAGDDKDKPAPKDGAAGSGMDRFLSSPWLALAAMGFGMAGSRNPRMLGALGEGGLQGVQVAQAQLKNQRELEALKSTQAYRTAQLELSRTQGARRDRQIDEQTRMHGAQEQQRLRLADQAERRQQEVERRNAEREQMARAQFDKPTVTKDEDPYTGRPIWKNGAGDLFLRDEEKGTLVPYTGIQSGARMAGYKDDPAKDRTLALPSGDINIPALDPRDRTLDKKTRDEAAKRAAEVRKSGSMAGDVQRQIEELKKAYSGLPTSGAMAPGAWAETWRNVARQANALTDTLGLPPTFDPAKVGNLDEMKKLTIQLAATATKAFNSNRPTNFDFEQMLQGTPGAQLGPDAFKKIVGVMEAQNQRARDLARYSTEYERHRRTAYGFEDAFNEQRPDDYYVKRAGIAVPQRPGAGGAGAPGSSATSPIDVATPAEAGKLPKGTFIRDPKGNVRQVP